MKVLNLYSGIGGWAIQNQIGTNNTSLIVPIKVKENIKHNF